MRITTTFLLLIIGTQLFAQTTSEKFDKALTVYQSTTQLSGYF